jgi:ATP-dependent DNA ligase
MQKWTNPRENKKRSEEVRLGANYWPTYSRTPPEHIRLSEELRGAKDDLLRVAQEFGLEGLVAKKPNSVYESGRRSGAWVKFKITKSQEFVIGGYTLPEGSRSHFDLGLLFVVPAAHNRRAAAVSART